jgi:hypothetical protein
MLTLSLQSVANANRDGRMRHVFGLVFGPAGASAAAGVSVTANVMVDIGIKYPLHELSR